MSRARAAALGASLILLTGCGSTVTGTPVAEGGFRAVGARSSPTFCRNVRRCPTHRSRRRSGRRRRPWFLRGNLSVGRGWCRRSGPRHLQLVRDRHHRSRGRRVRASRICGREDHCQGQRRLPRPATGGSAELWNHRRRSGWRSVRVVGSPAGRWYGCVCGSHQTRRIDPQRQYLKLLSNPAVAVSSLSLGAHFDHIARWQVSLWVVSGMPGPICVPS